MREFLLTQHTVPHLLLAFPGPRRHNQTIITSVDFLQPATLLAVTPFVPSSPSAHHCPPPLLCGPLSVVPPRLQSGCRLPPPGVGVRSWGTHSTNPWRTMRRACGAPTSSRASKRPWPSIHPVAAGRSSSLTRARCTVRPPLCNTQTLYCLLQ